MNTIDMILKDAAPQAVLPDATVVDADLARGRAALANAQRRRTHRRAAKGGIALAVAAGVAAVVVTTSGSPHAASSTTPAPRTVARAKTTSRTTSIRGATATQQPQIKLVDYTGAQLPGFTVSQVPQGWQLSTSTSTALLITPDGSTNHDPDDFQDKLAVLTSSVDQPSLGSGDPVTVNGQPGRVHESSGVLMLTYDAPSGFGVVVQAPGSLNWSDAQIVDFAQGVQVTPNAVHTRG